MSRSTRKRLCVLSLFTFKTHNETHTMKNKKKVIVYADWIDTFEALTDEESGKLIKHFFRYINDQNPKLNDRLLEMVFLPIKQTLKRDLDKWKAKSLKNSENAKLRWNKKNTNAYERIKRNANHADSDSVSDSVSDTLYYESEEDFLADWKKAREAILKLPTNIQKLNLEESRIFQEVKNDFSIDYFRNAMQGLFVQENMFKVNQLRPAHFFRGRNYEKYYHCFLNKTQLFEDKKQQQKL